MNILYTRLSPSTRRRYSKYMFFKISKYQEGNICVEVTFFEGLQLY